MTRPTVRTFWPSPTPSTVVPVTSPIRRNTHPPATSPIRRDVYPPVPTTPRPSHHEKRDKVLASSLLTTGGFLVVCTILVVLIIFLRRRRKESQNSKNDDTTIETSSSTPLSFFWRNYIKTAANPDTVDDEARSNSCDERIAKNNHLNTPLNAKSCLWVSMYDNLEDDDDDVFPSGRSEAHLQQDRAGEMDWSFWGVNLWSSVTEFKSNVNSHIGATSHHF